MVLARCSEDDLRQKKRRTRPTGTKQKMALGDSLVAAIAFIRKYLPLPVTPTSNDILGNDTEVHRRIRLAQLVPALK